MDKRLDIERKLLSTLEQARAHYQALLRESAMALEVARDVGISTPDGRLSLQRSIEKQHALKAALEAFNDALHRFNFATDKPAKAPMSKWHVCAERDSLAAGFEKAVDKYIQAARAITATTDVSEIAVFHASVQLSRQRLREHCQRHGCNLLWINGLA